MWNYNYLCHSGIKGQKWGVRRFQNEDGTLTEEGKQRYGYYDRADGTKDYKRLQKDAAKDAKEWAQAKAYYGEGAGNRRKILKNKLSQKMKDADYKAEFERLLSQQDMSKVQRSANRERKVQDVKNTVGKTARGVKNLMLGVGSATLTAVALYNVAKLTGADKVIGRYGKQALSSIIGGARNVVDKMKYGGRGGFGIGPNGQIDWGAFRR